MEFQKKKNWDILWSSLESKGLLYKPLQREITFYSDKENNNTHSKRLYDFKGFYWSGDQGLYLMSIQHFGKFIGGKNTKDIYIYQTEFTPVKLDSLKGDT